LSEALYFIRS